MRSRSMFATGAVLALTAGLTWAATGPAQAGGGSRPDRTVATCHYRVCLLVIDEKADRDGDGVTDIDELAAGTDPDDRWSYPGAPELIDQAINGKLTSFNRHLTEIVVLPKMTPDGKSLATGFGAFELPSKAWLANDPRDGLAKIRGNGFSGRIGLGTDLMKGHDKDTPPWGRFKDASLYAGGTLGFGPNGSQSGGYVGGHRQSDGTQGPEVVFSGDSTYYKFNWVNNDGTRDEITTWGETNLSGNQVDYANYTSYDADGNKTGFTSSSSEHEEDPKTGESHDYTESDTTNFDPKAGEKTGSSKTTVDVTVHNGVKTTTTSTVYYDADGNETGGDSTVVEESCPNNKCEDGYYNSEYIAPGPITGEDFARVITRINSSRTPGPDNGLGDATGTPPKQKWPLVSLVNPDGVTVFAISFTPRFNTAQPEYDPRLADLAPLAGIKPPVHNENGTTSWPSGDPYP